MAELVPRGISNPSNEARHARRVVGLRRLRVHRSNVHVFEAAGVVAKGAAKPTWLHQKRWSPNGYVNEDVDDADDDDADVVEDSDQ